jgi:aminoglycoside phosphotransferase (APT) family kinase protein
VEAALLPLPREELENRGEEAITLFNRLHCSEELLEALSTDLTEADRAGISPQNLLFAETHDRWFNAVVERWLAYGLEEITDLSTLVGGILNYLETLRIEPLDIVVPCHNDPNHGNFMLNRTGALRMIDFEGLALNNPVADLGIFLTWYQDRGLHQDLLDQYQLSDPERLLDQMRLWVPLRYLNITAHWAARLTRAHDRIDWEFAVGSVEEWLRSACELVYDEGVPPEVLEVLDGIKHSLMKKAPAE